MNEQTASQELLGKCRRLMTGRLRRSFSVMLRQLNETLFEMSISEGSAAGESRYIDTIRDIQFRRRELELRFENRLSTLFDSYASGRLVREPRDAQAADELAPPSATVLQSQCAAVLMQLDRRLASLMGPGRAAPASNPLLPEHVYSAFDEACRDLESRERIRPLLMLLFERHIASDLQQVYRDANELLEREGVGAHAAGSGGSQGAAATPGKEKRAEMIRYWVSARIEKVLDGRDVPDFVHAFLTGPWRRVLETAYSRGGEHGLDWKKAMQAVTDLVRSIEYSADPEERRQVIWMLPGLVYRLKIGMRSVRIPNEEQTRFLGELKGFQLRRLKESSVRRTDPVPDNDNGCVQGE